MWLAVVVGCASMCILLTRRYGGFFEQPNIGQAQAEDEDAFARRIWQEMEKRKHRQVNGASAARSYFAAERAAASARQQAEFEAAQRSRQILEEEKAKDRAWRDAVLKVSNANAWQRL